MLTKDFIEQLNKEFNLDTELLTVRENKNVPGLGNIFLGKAEICPIPLNDIYEERKDDHFIVFNDGRKILHPSSIEIKSKIILFLDRWNNEEGFKELMTEEE